MKEYEIVIEGEDGLFQDLVEASDKADLYKILKGKYPEDIGADAIGYDEDGEEFPILW
jgi:hypothetical protein|tara:strand:+ start:189 stop:362 length:174 start_codon:yes stop_codon:yes gene_type:complete